MPIRMTDDQQEQNHNDYNDGQGGDGNRRWREEVVFSLFYLWYSYSNKSKSIIR